MPRYIDADKLLESATKNDFNDLLDYDIFRFLVEEAHTADVVPKSEVERLEKLYNDMTQEAKGYLNRLYGIRAEVAREIFAEIERICVGMQDYTDYAELKKKYQEGEPNG